MTKADRAVSVAEFIVVQDIAVPVAESGEIVWTRSGCNQPALMPVKFDEARILSPSKKP